MSYAIPNMPKVIKLLTASNSKILKGEKIGYLTMGIHLSPEKKSGFNVCKHASKGCAASCLDTAGQGVYKRVQLARIAKTLFFFRYRNDFFRYLTKEIACLAKRAKRKNMIPAVRLNLTSDLPWNDIKISTIGISIIELFPMIQFYDYTKDYPKMLDYLAGKLPANYHLTFSRSETNHDQCESVIQKGGNVAIVFKTMPETYLGVPVVNGDESDVRFLDGKNVIVGLKAKGKARKDTSGFVVTP